MNSAIQDPAIVSSVVDLRYGHIWFWAQEEGITTMIEQEMKLNDTNG